jgi:hypothetical protein
MSSSQQQHEANYAKLIAAGVDPAWLNKQFGVNGKDNLAKGNYIDNKDYSRVIGAWNKAPEKTAFEAARAAEAQRIAAWEASIPDFLKNDPAFQALSQDQKEIITYNYNIQMTDNAEDAKKLAEALESAKAQAEPYWQNIVAIAQDELLRNFEIAEGDYNSSVQRQQRIIENINQDLSKNKDFLSLEQQADLATLARNYEVSHESLIDSAAGAGLTFSTKRKIAEKRLNEENQGMVESTTRSYNKQIMDLQTEADRGNIEAQKEIENLQRKLGESKTSIGRAGEKYLGTENLPTLPGYNAMGNITGDLYEQKTADIEARKDALYNEATSGSLDLSI